MKKSSKRKRSHPPNDSSDTIFALLLASISQSETNNYGYYTTLVKKCLNKQRLSLRSKTLQTLPNSILSLLPILLNSRCAGIALRSAEIVGLASLLSLEANQQVALDNDILNSLVMLLTSDNRKVSVSACNAVLDLSTTLIGRQRLLQLFTLEKLMSKFLQVMKSSNPLFSLCIVDNGNVIGFEEDGIPVLLLEAAIVLINTCNIEQLKIIPRKLSEDVIIVLNKLWVEVHNQMLLGSTFKSGKEKISYLSSISSSSMAECIFRLSINAVPSLCLPLEVVRRYLFGLDSSSFEYFMLHHWELSPFILRRSSRALNNNNKIFDSFIDSLNCKGKVTSSVSSSLQSLVSCVPISSDEFDILRFLKEAKDKLGGPITYQQDLRVLKTDMHLKREVHFFQVTSDRGCTKGPHLFYIDDILKCDEAYKEGYTVALRGMEFRFRSVAAIADGLATLYGQPSVGANMYLTPPNSQGLAPHCDDHCVFVCQLVGTKRWTVATQPTVQLPRLYEPLDGCITSELNGSKIGSFQVTLEEGDVLYIPRGFSHEACTDDGGTNSPRSSLHLTLGIEVEPPFD